MIEISDLAGKYLEWGSRRWSLIDLVDVWARRVLKFNADLSIDPIGSDASAWFIYDLISSVHLRDVIEDELNRLYGADHGPVAVLLAVDELYRAITVEDERQIVRSLEPHDNSGRWWWGRRPARGPIAREIEEIIARSESS